MTQPDNEINLPDDDYESRTRNLAGAIEDIERAILEEAKAKRATDNFEDLVPWVIEFRIVGTPDIIRAPVREELFFGRADERNGIYPQIDLSKHGAQQLGVSRKHALMIARDNRVTIEDLGSANGTYINGQQLTVGKPYRLYEGDIVQLGNLKLQTHFVIKPHIDDDTMHGLGNEVEIPVIGKGQRILILDDNRDVCRVLKFVSKKSGFETTVVNTLQEAITSVDALQVDAIITEVMLQEGSGLDLIQYVRVQRADKEVPIIAIGNDSGGFREGQAYQKGADIFVGKPLALDTMVEALRKIAPNIVK